MWVSKEGSVLTYDIGTVQNNFCGKITILDSIICGNESIRNLTQCIKASIFPRSNCIGENPLWDRSSISVLSNCNAGSSEFTITNNGSGGMTTNQDYRIYVDDTLIYTSSYILNSGAHFTVSYPAKSQTIRLEADQHPLHPGISRPRSTLENCGVSSTISRNFVITAPQDDLDEEVAITCNTIRDSFDPNDKQVIPIGTGLNHSVLPGQELEYTIRFQNTGTDTAYTIRVVDTIDVALDVSSFTQGLSSHDYTFDVSGKNKAVLSFNFYGINLPDSTTNQFESNGLVSFRIKIPSNTSIGSTIRNKAYIYFDYNSPIETNETFHNIDNIIISDLTKGDLVTVGVTTSNLSNKLVSNVKVYPNPTSGIITIETSKNIQNKELRIISVLGIIEKSIQLNNSTQQEVILDIQQGLYLYQLLQNGELVSGGKLQIQ